ncbi:MAG TPA: tetratricopeptide repeat protein [Terriglobales bacterium]|nr:tetratricopeptide repeat protein [Terriglobales bacterium]
MAFGFGFNKQKVLSAAEKFVQQGKLQNAIAEYDKVLKHDANDLTVNNTIGDLYARIGDSAKAIECFKTVGDAYAAQGFTVKGIAMYKKITKLQPSMDSSLKLAELYTQQGLFNDARAQYLQVAEDFMKNGDLEQAVRLFRKVLEMDPENVPMRVKLAEVYVRLGKKKEAWEIFSAAAESLRARGSLTAAEDILRRMLVLDPGNSYVLLLRGRAAVESDDPKHAIEYLEKVPDLDSHPEGLRDLLKAYLQVGALPKAGPIAEKLLAVHNDPEGLFLMAEGSTRLGQYHEALDVYTRHADHLLATDSTKLLSSLHSMISHVRDDAGALDALMALLNKAGDTTHVNEVTELLAHTSVKDGNLARARDLYQALATTEPQNQLHMQNYQQVVERMEGVAPAAGITAEEGAVIVEELEATAPVIDQSYPDHIAIAVRSAVTDADLFLSYNLPDKAIVPLLGALPQAPRDARLNQRLAALHTRFQRFTEAAVCCRTLEGVYHDAGYPDEAVRYGELAARYEQSAETTVPLPATFTSASSTVGPPMVTPAPATPPVAAPPVAARTAAGAAAAVPSAPWPMAPPTAAGHEIAPPAHPEFAVPELPIHPPSDPHDLSSEWEHSLSVDETAPAAELSATVEAEAQPDADASSNPEIAETVEEIRFYLEHFMTDQARTGIEKLESLTSDARILDPLRAAVESASQPAAEPESEMAEINADEINADEINADQPAEFEVAMESPDGPEIAASADLMGGYDHEIRSAPPAKLAPEPEPAYPEPAHSEPVHAEANDLTALVADLEASLGDAFPQAPPAPEPPATRSPAIQSPAARPPAAQPLPGRPAAPAPKRPAATSVPRKREPEPEPVANIEIKTPAAPTMPAIAASAGGAATAAAPAQVKPAMSYSSAAVRPLGAGAQAMHASDSVDLSEMFGELKQELEEDVAAGDDDPETHYNLGVAFREMGLLDEAIAELQKVCNSIERGKAFSQPVQTYTWLAQCFLDKGVPDAAIRWYEKALNIPGLDDEARLAINYELGSACETAMDKPAALRHFTSVYGSNIDYRDVAERIQALKS